MRALVVYESMFGNTKTVAQAIARGLARHGEVDLFEVGDAPDGPDADVDLLVVGGPTHAFGLSRPNTRASARQSATSGIVSPGIGLREWIVGLGFDVTAPVAAFDTRIRRPRLPGSAARAALRRLRKLGYRAADHPQSFWVQGTKGPLYPGEIDRAESWGRKLASTVGVRT